MTMTTKELLALVGKATPGPWRDAGAGRERHMLYADLKGVPTPVADVGWFPDIDTDSANAALIVAAVNDLPALCAEVEALRKVRDAAAALMAYRVGEYPLRGDLRDNDASRAQINALATAIDAARSRNEH